MTPSKWDRVHQLRRHKTQKWPLRIASYIATLILSAGAGGIAQAFWPYFEPVEPRTEWQEEEARGIVADDSREAIKGRFRLGMAIGFMTAASGIVMYELRLARKRSGGEDWD